MCGLFGAARAESGGGVRQRLCLLGTLAQDRGVDAAGVAVLGADCEAIRVRKAVGPFRKVITYRDLAIPRLMGTGRVTMGHTRAASVGRRDSLKNAHPFVCGPIIGAHNGTIRSEMLAREFGVEMAARRTDSEVLFSALSTVSDPVEVLEAVHGTAALTWFDTRQPGQLFLARVKERPLNIAFDTRGNLWWGSIASWFSSLEASNGVSIDTATALSDGQLLVVDVTQERPAILESRRFRTPQAYSFGFSATDDIIYGPPKLSRMGSLGVVDSAGRNTGGLFALESGEKRERAAS